VGLRQACCALGLEKEITLKSILSVSVLIFLSIAIDDSAQAATLYECPSQTQGTIGPAGHIAVYSSCYYQPTNGFNELQPVVYADDMGQLLFILEFADHLSPPPKLTYPLGVYEKWQGKAMGSSYTGDCTEGISYLAPSQVHPLVAGEIYCGRWQSGDGSILITRVVWGGTNFTEFSFRTTVEPPSIPALPLAWLSVLIVALLLGGLAHFRLLRHPCR